MQQLGRDTGDLGLAVDDVVERDAVAGGQLGAQDRLVEVAERLLMPFQHSRRRARTSGRRRSGPWRR